MSETVECSRCGTPVAPEGDSLPPFCPNCGAQLEAAQVLHEFDPQVDYRLALPPRRSKIAIIEASNERLVLSIPAGGKRASSMGCLAILWMLITGGVTAGFALAALQGENFGVQTWIPILFLGVFWLIGIVILGFAIRMKYARGYLFLSRDRAVHQWILFGRKKNTEIALDETSYAHLVESYQENDIPVYRIQIDGRDGNINYGTGMNPEHKQWYVETINQFIAFQYGSSNSGSPAAANRDQFGEFLPTPRCPACGKVIPDHESTNCPSCGASLDFSDVDQMSAHILEEIAPESLPHDFPIRVNRSVRGDWELTCAIRKVTENTRGLGCLLAFGALWEAFIIAFTGGVLMAPGVFRIFMLLFTIPFHLVGLSLISLGLFCLLGKFRLKLGADRSSAFWGVGRLGYTRRFSTSSITDVKLVQGAALASFKNTQRNRPSRSRSEGNSCILMAAGKRVPVTSGSKPSDSRTAAGLIRYCLHDLGHRLQDE